MKTDAGGASVRQLIAEMLSKGDPRLERLSKRGGQIGKLARYARKARKVKAL